MHAQQFVDQIIPHKNPQQTGHGEAPVNIALSKYWGKRDVELNLPTNSSLSISLPGLGTTTTLSQTSAEQDQIELNGQSLDPTHPFARRLSLFLDYFRPSADTRFEVRTENTVPTAAGLASSASGYAALVLALNDCYQWQLNHKQLSLLARLGSGSASRSLFDGFAIWHQGEQADGMDSYAEPIASEWPEFTIGLVEVDTTEKPIGSTAGMQQTVNSCDLYQAWPQKAEADVQTIHQAILDKNFGLLGSTAENNALSMHATMMATWPPIVYWQPESVAAMHKVWQLRNDGVEVYFTMDAGPNLKLIFLQTETPAIQQAFGNEIKLIQPFNSAI